MTPSSVLQITLDEREETLLKQEPVLGDFDSGPLHHLPGVGRRPRRDAGPDLGGPPQGPGTAGPVLLYGYGAYEISIDPTFSPHRLSLYDRGVVFAIAHVRGGGEMGRAWYEDGRMEHKANTFSDFIACGRHLIDAGIAQPGRLVGPGRLGRRPAHRRRGQPGARALPGARGRGAVRRLRDHHARRRAAR